MRRDSNRGKTPMPGRTSRALPRWRLAIAATLLAMPPAAHGLAGTYNPDRSIGDVVPAWEKLPGTDGKEHSWADVADRDAVVVVFTCNSCPYAVDYEDRLNDLAGRHRSEEHTV